MGRAPKNAFGCTLLLSLLVAIPSTATSRPEARDSHQEESTKAQSQDKEEKKEDKEKKRFIYWDEGLHIIGLKHLSAMKIGGSVQVTRRALRTEKMWIQRLEASMVV